MIKRVLLIAFLAASPIDAEPVVPAGKWVVNFADAQCIASREYGAGDSALTLILKPSPLGNVMQIGIAQPGSKSVAEQVEANVKIDDGAPISTNASVYGMKTATKQILYMINLPWSDFAPMRDATHITVEVNRKLKANLQLTQMKGLSDAMDRCLQDLQEVWNVGETRAARLKQPARANPPLRSIFSSDDYPLTALSSSQGGRLTYVLLIDEKGTVADCTIDQTSGYASLDAQSCYVIRTRAKYSPALGADGRAAKSAVSGWIRWGVSTEPRTGSRLPPVIYPDY